MNPITAAQVNHRKGYGRVRPYSKKDSWREGMIYFSFIAASKTNSITRCNEGRKQTSGRKEKKTETRVLYFA